MTRTKHETVIQEIVKRFDVESAEPHGMIKIACECGQEKIHRDMNIPYVFEIEEAKYAKICEEVGRQSDVSTVYVKIHTCPAVPDQGERTVFSDSKIKVSVEEGVDGDILPRGIITI